MCLFLLIFAPVWGTCVKSEKNSAFLKRAMTERHAGWSRKDGISRFKTLWRASAVEDAGQSSHDKWKSTKFQGKWKEVSIEMDVPGSSLKKKKLWNKSRMESAKRETDQYKMTEIVANDEMQEDNERNIIKKTLEQFSKEQDEADEARALLHDLHQNVDEVEAQIEKTCAQSQRKESIVTLAAERFSLGEMMVLQDVSVLITTYVKEWQYKDISERC